MAALVVHIIIPLSLAIIPILRQQKDWMSGIEKWPFLLIFSTVLIADIVKEKYSKFIYSEKATKFCEILTLLCIVVKSKVKISQNFVAFSEYMNFA